MATKQVTRYRDCDVCKKQDDVTTHKFVVDGHKYTIDLCDEHESDFDNDLYAWTSCATKTGEPSIFDTPRRSVRVTLDTPRFAPTPAAESEREAPVEELPITAQRWTLTDHAKERMVERGFTMQQVLWAAERPETSKPNDRGDEGTFSNSRGDCIAIVNPTTLSILTVKYSTKHPLSPHYKKVNA